jgi:hypothetical protein
MIGRKVVSVFSNSETRTTMAPLTTREITIRPTYADDEVSLRRLAVLDSAPAVPPAPLLLAEIDGELRAALSLKDGSSIADPFHPTADVVELLRVHAAAMERWGAGSRRRHRRPRLRPALLRAV